MSLVIISILQLSHCNQLPQHSCRRSASQASPCQKSWLTTERCYHFLPASQRECSAPAPLLTPRCSSEAACPEGPLDLWLVLHSWGCCAVRTCVINPNTSSHSPSRAGRNKMGIQESLWYNGAGHLQFSSQGKSVRDDCISSYAKSLLMVSLLSL